MLLQQSHMAFAQPTPYLSTGVLFSSTWLSSRRPIHTDRPPLNFRPPVQKRPRFPTPPQATAVTLTKVELPVTGEKSPRTKITSAADVMRLALPEWKALLIGVISSVTCSSILLLTPIAFGRVLDIVSSFHRTGAAAGLAELNRGAARLFFIYCLGAVCRLAEVALMRIAGERVVSSLRRRVFGKIVYSDVAMLESTTTGELMSRLSSDTLALQRVMTDDVVKLLQGALETLVACVMLFVLCKKLALFVYLTVPLSICAGFYYGNRTASLAKALSVSLAKASQVANEQLNGIRIVKSFAREAFAEAQYNAKIRDVLAIGHRAALADGVLQGWNRGVFSAVTCGILLFGGRQVAMGSLSIGSMMAFVLYTSNLTAALGKLSSGIGEVVRSSGAVDRIMMILGSNPRIESRRRISTDHSDIGYGVEQSGRKGAVEFRNVSFKYAGSDREVLKNISFEVAGGGSVAFVGSSGGGKSTALSLLSRFYEPTSGEILLDGRPLKKHVLQELRQNVIGIVAQEAYMISGTLVDNIAFGRPNATRGEIEKAAEAAGVMEFARRLPKGLETTVQKLSGGEQQRLMIARCLVKNPAIIVLDEPTSALDRRSAALVNATIDKLIQDKGRTVILISHRLSTVKHCDKVIVFDKGEVVEQGAHSDLLTKNGAYCKLLNAVM